MGTRDLAGHISARSQTLRSLLARHAWPCGMLALLAAALFLYRLGDRAAWSSHEGRAGQHAQLMIDSGDWGMPRLYGGITDYQKPPMYYWLVASIAQIFGGTVDEWSIRLPSAGAAVCGILLLYGAAASIWRPATGCIAALILASTFRYGWLARVGRIDMPFTFCVSLSLVCFYFAITRVGGRSYRSLAAGYSALAAAILLKGPVGLVLVGTPIALFLIWNRLSRGSQHESSTGLSRLELRCGVPLVCLIAAPWYVWATWESDGRFLETFLWHHHLDRAIAAAGLKAEPIWYYVPRLFVDTFPWSLLIPWAAYAAVSRHAEPESAPARFSICWVFGMFAFLSLVRFKRHDYLLPLVPGIALLLASYWDRLSLGRASGREWRWSISSAAVVVLLSLVGAVMFHTSAPANAVVDAEFVQKALQDTDRMVVAQIAAIGAELRGGCTGLVAATALLGTASMVFLAYRRVLPGVLCIALASAGSLQFYVHRVMPRLEPLREQRTLAEFVRRTAPAGAPLYYYGRESPQLMFYLGPRARWLPSREALRPVITQSQPAFVVMEMERYEIRKSDWSNVAMVPLRTNTENVFRTHHDPVVLVTNDAGALWVRRHPADVTMHAN